MTVLISHQDRHFLCNLKVLQPFHNITHNHFTYHLSIYKKHLTLLNSSFYRSSAGNTGIAPFCVHTKALTATAFW